MAARLPVSEQCKRGLRNSRQCHDCGKPTNDYRCKSCLQKWRIKNKVPVTGRGELIIYDGD